MNSDQAEGKWKQLKGSLKEKWGELTDDDLTVIAGNRQKLAGILQERYGIAKDEAQKRADEWAKSAGITGYPETGERTRTGKP